MLVISNMGHIKFKKEKEARGICISSQPFWAVFGTLHAMHV
jgi:hypothetical protein